VPADLILYALVAGGLVFWLRSVLGTRHGEERDRSQNFEASVNEESGDVKNLLGQNTVDKDDKASLNEDSFSDLLNAQEGIISIDNKVALQGLEDIAEFDKNFALKPFLETAQDVFAMVVEGFGEGDRGLLEDLLGENVYNAFEAAITAREDAEETLENEIHAIKRSEIIEASLAGKKGIITIRFVADETSVLKDSSGEIIEGHPDKITEMVDIWTFSKDLKSRDPRWFVIETRGDFEGDNETLPNTE